MIDIQALDRNTIPAVSIKLPKGKGSEVCWYRKYAHLQAKQARCCNLGNWLLVSIILNIFPPKMLLKKKQHSIASVARATRVHWSGISMHFAIVSDMVLSRL